MKTYTSKSGAEFRLVSLADDDGWGISGTHAGVELTLQGDDKPLRYWGLGRIEKREKRTPAGPYGATHVEEVPVPEAEQYWGLDTEFGRDLDGNLTYPLSCKGFGSMGCTRSALADEGVIAWLNEWARVWDEAGRPYAGESSPFLDEDHGIGERMRLRAEVAAGQSFMFGVEETVVSSRFPLKEVSDA